MHRRGLRRSVWVPLLALPLVIPASGVIGPHAPGQVVAAPAPVSTAEPVDTDGNPVGVDGSLPVTILPGDLLLANSADPQALTVTAGPSATLPSGPLGIPSVALDAYVKAARLAPPACHLQWSLLASIGRIESGHARGGNVDAAGTTRAPILGPVLNGAGYAAIADTDGGVWDGDAQWDRAVGPMQFIPSTWRAYAADGNGDGRADPHNLYDSTLAAARYLCAGGLDTADSVQRAQAVFRYNHSDSYVATVLLWADAYAQGVRPTENAVGPVGTLPGPDAPVAFPAPGAVVLLPIPVITDPGAPLPPTTTTPTTTEPTGTPGTTDPGTTTDSATQPPDTTPSSSPVEPTPPPETTTAPETTTDPPSSDPTTTTTSPTEESPTVQNDPITTAAVP